MKHPTLNTDQNPKHKKMIEVAEKLTPVLYPNETTRTVKLESLDQMLPGKPSNHFSSRRRRKMMESIERRMRAKETKTKQ